VDAAVRGGGAGAGGLVHGALKPVEEALSGSPILIYEQDTGDETRWVYYGETSAGRMLAVVVTERRKRIRVVTAYDLDAGQKRHYLVRRLRGE